MRMKRRQLKFADRRQRSGAAAVEAALSVPLLIILVMGSIEAANAVFGRQVVATAAYDAARIVTKNGGTETEANARCQQMLNSQGITNYTITYNPAVTPTTAPGTNIRVTVIVPASHVSMGLLPPLLNHINLRKRVQMVRL